MAITHAPLVSAIIIPKPPSLGSAASPLRSLSLNTHATFIYTGRDLSISDSLETVIVSIHIPFSLYFNPALTHHASISFLKPIATPAMASSSSDFSNSSTESETSQEMTPKFDSKAAYETCAPLHWDVEEWDFCAWSEDNESLTDGEDLQFLLDVELEDEDDDNDVSWEGHFSSSKEEDDDESTEEDLTVGSFLRARSPDEDDGGDFDDGADGDDGSTSDDGVGDDGSDGGSSDDDGDVGTVPPIKHRRFSGTYWW
jgi:hypothetical protein